MGNVNCPQNAVPVLIEKPEEVKPVYIHNIDENSYVGFARGDGRKGYLIITYKRFICINHDEKGRVGSILFDSLEELIKATKATNAAQLFSFNTAKDLYKWLAED